MQFSGDRGCGAPGTPRPVKLCEPTRDDGFYVTLPFRRLQRGMRLGPPMESPLYDLWQLPTLNPRTYLYLRTRTAIEYANEALALLSAAWSVRVELLQPFINGTWENGLVLGLNTESHPRELADTMKPGLDSFDAWAIHNVRGEYAEWIADGPVSVHYRATESPNSGSAQIFLGFDNISDPARGDNIVESIRQIYGPEKCRPVFHFRDGRIMLLATREPARTIFRRIERAARNRVYETSVCDCRGEPFGIDGREIWDPVWLEQLSFSPETGNS
jgi:hypothetical protein